MEQGSIANPILIGKGLDDVDDTIIWPNYMEVIDPKNILLIHDTWDEW